MQAAAPRRLAESTSPAAGAASLPIVAVSVSAAGLDAFRKLLNGLLPDFGMAFVCIPFPGTPDVATVIDLLGSPTPLRVVPAHDGIRVAKATVYVVPAGSDAVVTGDRLHLPEPADRYDTRLPFASFIQSLAEERGDKAICLVLSGIGPEGSLGIEAVTTRGGVVLAEAEDEERSGERPEGHLKMPIDEIAEFLIDYSNRGPTPPVGIAGDDMSDWLPDLIELLQKRVGRDLGPYKPETVRRWIDRRMKARGMPDRRAYLAAIRSDSNELELLSRELMPKVTSFFRDPNAYAYLREAVLPQLIRDRAGKQSLRVWVPGCSSGEEAYSLAMLLLEAMADAEHPMSVQVFATDIDPAAIEQARRGLYPKAIEDDVSPARLERFFVREDSGYRVAPQLRATVVVAVQDVFADAPFANLDMVSCRNFLTFLRASAQRRLLSLFHFLLGGRGVLFLGESETVGGLADCFDPVSGLHRIYRPVGQVAFSDTGLPAGAASGGAKFGGADLAGSLKPTVLRDITRRHLADAFGPPSVLIDPMGTCLYLYGAVGRHLRLPTGQPSRDLLLLVHLELRYKLKMAIGEASRTRVRQVVQAPYPGRMAGGERLSIEISPVTAGDQPLLLVSFIESAATPPRTLPKTPGEVLDATRLAFELEIAKSDLAEAFRELDLAKREHQELIEETIASNEELLTANEELVASKEELQSVNEELALLNQQLRALFGQQQDATNDLRGIMNSTGMATLFLDSELTIRFFTQAAQSFFPILSTDVGRPLADLNFLANDANLIADARSVMASSVPLTAEIEARANAWYLRRIEAYRSRDGEPEGVVITFTDITELKRAAREIQAARAFSESIIETVSRPLVVLDNRFRIVSANNSFYRVFASKPELAVGRPLPIIVNGNSDMPGLLGFLERVAADASPVDDYETTVDLPTQGRRALQVKARKMKEESVERKNILLIVEDVTERKQAAEALARAKQEAERLNAAKSHFLAAASHDLRQPLQTISLVRELMARTIRDPNAARLLGRLNETIESMTSLLDTLLDVNQLEAGMVAMEIVDFPVNTLLSQLRKEFSIHAAASSLRWRVVPSSLHISSDPRLLKQILVNLVSNAVKYTREGKLLLGCRRRGEKLLIEVWDTGAGIPAEDIQVIFEEFRQLDNPARDRTKGFGLGLALVNGLAGLLGHPIRVRSAAGKGSVFAVEVPLSAAQPERVQPPSVISLDPADRRPVVLVVEDDAVMREMLGLLLDAEGYRVLVAADGIEADKLAEQEAMPPAVVLADYNLPNGVSGIDAVNALRRRFDRDIPAIMLTGDITTGTLREMGRLGYIHLAKPVQAGRLMRELGQLVGAPAKRGVNKQDAPTVSIIDDNAALREAMRDFLVAEGRNVAFYNSAEDFLDDCEPTEGDCLVVDMRLPGMSGLELLRHLAEHGRRIPAIMVTGHGEVSSAVASMKAGAIDFIEKPVDPQVLLTAIDQALQQEDDGTYRANGHDAAVARLAELSPREREILKLVLAGHPSKNIAADLDISRRTVENHRASIMRKTGATSLSELIRLALAAGS